MVLNELLLQKYNGAHRKRMPKEINARHIIDICFPFHQFNLTRCVTLTLKLEPSKYPD